MLYFPLIYTAINSIYPLVRDPQYLLWMTKIFILKKEGVIEKNSYDRRAYESVDYIGAYVRLYLKKLTGKQN